MHGMKKKRVPRTLTNPIVEAIRGCQPIQGKDLADMHALDALADGTATKRDWGWVASMFNVAEAMACDGMGVELIPITAEARVILARAYVEAEKTGRWHLPPDKIWALRNGWEYHDLQRRSVTLSEYRRYAKKVVDVRRTGANALSCHEIVERADGL